VFEEDSPLIKFHYTMQEHINTAKTIYTAPNFGL